MTLIDPPADPRPPSVESEPRTTCTESTANTSRVCEAGSRTPSTKVDPWLSKPRMNGRSPIGLPPSAAPKVMPGIVRSASSSVDAPASLITCAGSTTTERGVSIGLATSFAPCRARAPVTRMSSRVCTWPGSLAAGSAGAGAGVSPKAGPEMNAPTQLSARKAGVAAARGQVAVDGMRMSPSLIERDRY